MEIKTCTRCYKDKPISSFRFRKDRNDYNSHCRGCHCLLTSRHRLNWKANAIAYKGGKCIICGYNKCNRALNFHHINPKEKSFTISSMRALSWNTLVKEIDKCVLLCSNCHMEAHENLITLPKSV